MKFLLSIPVRLFPCNSIAASFYFVMSLLGLVVLFVQPYVIIQNYKETDIYASVNHRDTFNISPVHGLEDNKEIFVYIANLATFAMLNRNPNGLDNDLLFYNLFLPECQNQIMEKYMCNQALFVQKNVHQKSEAGKFHILKIGDSDGQVLIRSLGQLILTGIDKGKAFSLSYNFAADFTLVKNKNLKKKGVLPYVVAQVNFKSFPK